MDIEEGGGIGFGIVLEEREAVILRDLAAQDVTGLGIVGVLEHAARYERCANSAPSGLPRIMSQKLGDYRP
jgi:hypothetical protein